jgi:hypothetical protein
VGFFVVVVVEKFVNKRTRKAYNIRIFSFATKQSTPALLLSDISGNYLCSLILPLGDWAFIK